jgi:hypothetical protein
VLDKLDSVIAVQAFTRSVEHDLGEVEHDPAQMRTITLEQGE